MKIDDFIKTILGYEKIKVHGFTMETDPYNDEPIFVATVELYKSEQYRCPVCHDKCVKYGYQVNHTKRWRSLDLGAHKFYVECAKFHAVNARTMAFVQSKFRGHFLIPITHTPSRCRLHIARQKCRQIWWQGGIG